MKTTSRDGLIQFEFPEETLKMIEDALGDMKSESRKVLKNAVNATARQAKKDLAKKAQETYAVKQTKFSKEIPDAKKATVADPTATITIKGTATSLSDFKVTPSTVASSRRSAAAVKAKVLLKSSMKDLTSQSGAKAFIARFASGHVTVVQRVPGEEYRRDKEKRRKKYGRRIDVTRIKKLLSVSVPQMVGDQERVLGVVEPHIYSNLMSNIQKEITKVLK